MVKQRAEEALRSVRLPSWVDHLEVTRDVDWCDEPALRVWVLVKPGEQGALEDGNALLELHQAIHEAIHEAGIEEFPYLRFEPVESPKVA